MRSSVYALVIVSPFFLSMTVSGQEQKPLQASPQIKNSQLTITAKSSSSNPLTSSQKVNQRMSASQKLIHQRALALAEQRVRRINDRRQMGISLSRPTIRKSLFPSDVEILQPAPTLYYNPANFYSYWYRP